jgi:hypothetical protein
MEPVDWRELERIVVDTTIICLTSANALRLPLEQRFSSADIEGTEKFTSFYANRAPFTLAALPMWMDTQIAVHNGRISKACEAYDHREDFPYIDVLSAGVTGILEVCLAAAGAMSLDLVDAIRTRWAVIEEKALRRAA